VFCFLVRFYAPLALHFLPAILMPKAELIAEPSLLILLKKAPRLVADWLSSHGVEFLVGSAIPAAL
jgi:hypothetical protein